MKKEIIKDYEIYLQDVIYDVVKANPKLDIQQVYNAISAKIDINDFETCKRVLELIGYNKRALNSFGK